MDLVTNNRFLRFLWVYIIIVGFAFIFIIPPFQKTDEISHYYKTVAVANGNFFCPNLIPKSLYDFPEKMMSNFVNSDPQHRFPKGVIFPILKEKFDSNLVTEEISCTLPFIFYLPSAIFLALPIFFKINPLIIFYLGRLGFYLISVFLFYLAKKIIPEKFRLLLLSYLSFPMVLIQISSFNKEVFHIGFGALTLALFLNLKNKYSGKNFILFLISLTLFILPRPQYLPFLLLIFLIFEQHIKSKVIIIISLGISLVLGLIFYIQKLQLLSLNTFIRPQLLYLKLFPFKFISVLFNSYTNHIEAYYKSLIGTFGSVHYYLDWYIYTFYGVFLLLVIYCYAKTTLNFRFKELTSFIIISFLTSFLIFFSMYLYATPVAFPYIVDVQGRYFIMIVPYVIIVLAKLIQKYGVKLVHFAFILVTILLIKNTYDRYFDYSQAYYYDFSTFKNEKILSINKKFKQLVEINPDKKLIGLHFVVDNTKTNLTDWPIMVTFYEDDCVTELRKVVIGNSIVSQNYRDFIFSPSLSNISSICYTLEPFESKTFGNGYSFYVFGDSSTQQPLGLPIYAF